MSGIPTGRKVVYPPPIDFSPNDPPDPSFLPALKLEDEVVSSVFPAEALHFFQRENEHDGTTELCCRFVLETRARLDGTYRQEVRAYLLKRLVRSLNAYAAKALMEDLGITFDEFREALRKLCRGDMTLAAYGLDGFYSELDTLRAHRVSSENRIAELTSETSRSRDLLAEANASLRRTEEYLSSGNNFERVARNRDLINRIEAYLADQMPKAEGRAE